MIKKKNTSQKGIQIQLHILPKVCQQLGPQLRQYLYWYFLVVLMGVWYLWTSWNTQIVTFYSVKYLRNWDTYWIREYTGLLKSKSSYSQSNKSYFFKKISKYLYSISKKTYWLFKLSHIRPFCVIHGVSLY